MLAESALTRPTPVKRSHATAFKKNTLNDAAAMQQEPDHARTSVAALAEGLFASFCTYAYEGLKYLTGLEYQASEDENDGRDDDRAQEQEAERPQPIDTSQARRKASRTSSHKIEQARQPENPFESAARKASLTEFTKPHPSLHEQFARLKAQQQKERSLRPDVRVLTTTASPVQRALFADGGKRRGTLTPRTSQDAARVLNQMAPHTGRISRRHLTLTNIAPPAIKQRQVPGTPVLQSPAQQSPQTIYRSPGTQLASPLTQPHLFKTKKQAARTRLVREEQESLAQLIKKLEQEFPGHYEWKRVEAARRQRDAEIERLKKPARVPLPKQTASRVQQIMAGNLPQDEVLIERFNQPIRVDDLMTLRPGAWLNDEVINFYMNLINERSKQDGQSTLHCFNTFFYSNSLLPKGYAGVKRFAKRAKVDIAKCEMVLVPIHLGVHWCMSAVNRREKRIEYWDSLRGGPGQVHTRLREYMRNEDAQFAKEEETWSNYIPPSDEAPLQKNGHDCGVFACSTAECLARGAPVDFDQEDMRELRVRIAASILDGKIY